MQVNIPLISVIVPVYKAESTIHRCIDSIMKQSYNNLEIILVDDGSPDRCGSICDQYAAKDSRILVIHKKNGGQSDARNAALDIISGEYVGFVDSDDYVDTDMFLNMYNAIKQNDAQISICGFTKFFDDNSEEIENAFLETQVFENGEIMEIFLPDEKIGSQACNKLFNAELFANVRFPVGRVYEDLAILHHVFYRAKKIVCLPDNYYHYYIHDSSTSFTQNAGWAYGLYRAFADRVVFMKEKGYSGEVFDGCLIKACRFAIMGLRRWNKKSVNEKLYIANAKTFLKSMYLPSLRCKMMPFKMKIKITMAICACGIMKG